MWSCVFCPDGDGHNDDDNYDENGEYIGPTRP